MKKHTTILATFLLAIPFCVTAQEEVFPTGTVWKEVSEEVYYPEYPEYHTPMDTLVAHVFEIGPDTVIGQNTYKQVFMDDTLWDCVIREENGCVWMLADGYAEEFKLYDFNWDGRDTIVTQFLREQDRYASWVAPEDDLFPLDALRTEQGVQIASNFWRIVIRNLGCVADMNRRHCLLAHRMMYNELPGLIYYRVLWLRKNGKEVYRYYGKNEWTTGIDDRKIEPVSDSYSYDLQGRQLSEIPAKGMYIRNGKKYIRQRISRFTAVQPDLQSGLSEYQDLQSGKERIADAHIHQVWIANPDQQDANPDQQGNPDQLVEADAGKKYVR